MSGYLAVLLLALLPAGGNFLGGVAAEFLRVSGKALSFALHAAAGILFAVVGIELMPEALEGAPPWMMLIAFVMGGLVAIGIDQAIGLVRTRAACRAGGEVEAGPWGIYAGVSVDLFSDGLIIGTGSVISPALGLLLALGQVPADIPEGFATIATFKSKGVPRAKRVLLSASFALPILIGATIGYFAVRGQPEWVKLGLLAFTAGILLTVTVEEIVVEGPPGRRLALGEPLPRGRIRALRPARLLLRVTRPGNQGLQEGRFRDDQWIASILHPSSVRTSTMSSAP